MTEISLESYKHAIQAHAPDLPIDSIAFLGEGWANRLCLVNKTLIFRFPKSVDSEQQLLREIRLLPVLSPELPLPIPEYKYIAFYSEKYPYAFAGYERIPGESIHQPSAALRQSTWWRRQAGVFLTALHRIPIGTVMAVGLEGYPTPQVWREALAAKHAPYERHVCPLLTTAQCKAILSCLEKAIWDERMVAFSPVVLHQDFDFHNFLVDLENEQITGVLDFGSISIGDPAVDIAPEIKPFYRGRIDTGWDFRRDYYKRTGPLEDLLYIRTCGHEIPNLATVQDRKLLEIARIWQ